MGTKEKRKREEESSSDEDEEAKKIREELRKRRRIEHERRKEERRRKSAEEREQLMLANMSATERRSYLAEKEEKQLREQRDALKKKVEESRKTRQVEQDAEERAYQVKRAQWEIKHKTWTLDDESDDEDAAAAADAAAGDAADEDPFASFVTGLASTGAAAPAIIGVTDRRSNTVATLDEVKAAKWKAQKRQQQRAAAAAAAAPGGGGGGGDNAFAEAMEDESEDEKAASSFIAALKRFRPEDNPSPTPTPTPPPQETAAVADVEMGGEEGAAAAAPPPQDEEDAAAAKPSKEEVHFDFDDEDFKERSYHVQKKDEHIKDLKKVDHSSIDYPPFRKNFYVAARAMKGLAPQAVAERRHALDKMRVRVMNGSDPNQIPAPIEKWEQCGLSDGLIDTLCEQRFEVPFPIQAQGIPVIMSGLDMIGIARTGSGKTVAYLLPMIRHILDQPPLADSEGPIGWVLVPTRELAVQVHRTAALFCKKVKLRCCACYGGSPISDQIKELKRGVHIVIGTPGRLVDLMVANKGRVLSTYRATFCVLDEADRMFDDGFGPQVTKITDNMRPDRQMVMFSATFQKQIEAAAKRFLSPETVEVLVGGRCSASTNVTQFVECFEDADHKFKRLLQILGTWYAKGLILIFTETQQEVDELWEALFKAGYDENCVTLHGGMDQLDRDLALHEFKVGGKHILVATSVASRGIDVADLELVVNYRVPSHIEDYIHRIGRTGRAGKRGTAYTFYMIGQDEAHATSLVKVLQESNNQVPEDLQNISNACWEARNSGQITNWNPSNKYVTSSCCCFLSFSSEKKTTTFAQRHTHTHTHILIPNHTGASAAAAATGSTRRRAGTAKRISSSRCGREALSWTKTATRYVLPHTHNTTNATPHVPTGRRRTSRQGQHCVGWPRRQRHHRRRRACAAHRRKGAACT